MNPYQKVAFFTLGCKLNFSETSTISRLFEDSGIAKVEFNEPADFYIINTCSVTQNADKECRRLVKKALQTNSEAFIIVIGCYAQLKPEEIAQIEGVDLVLGANEKFNVLEHVKQLKDKGSVRIENTEIKTVKSFHPAYSGGGDRTRTFLKVQDGCDYFCSFCTIPLARGFSRSANIEKTLLVAKSAIEEGAKEIVLTGVNLGDFGSGTDESFYDLLKALLKINAEVRYRISSIEPNLLSDDIIKLVASEPQIVPHFHIPLQSGSDDILSKMRRRYDSALYRSRIELIKSLMPNACIGADVIVGYPGEGDKEFEDTFNFLHSLDLSYLHVFTYSERDNTPAVRRIDEVVPKAIRAERSKRLHILSDKLKRRFYEGQVGKVGLVIPEADEELGYMNGFSENYIKVRIPFDSALINQVIKVQYKEIHPDGVMKAELILDQSKANLVNLAI